MDTIMKTTRISSLIFMISALQLAACSMQPRPTEDVVDQPYSSLAGLDERWDSAPAQVQDVQAFEGQWSYRNDCDRGHYVTLDIKNESGLVTGSWSDGTLVRGSQGRLRGRIEQGRLVVERCSESEEAGGPALCPNYQKSQDYLVVKGDALAWYQEYGSEPVEYVVLSKGVNLQQPMQACDEDPQGVEQ